MVRRVKGICSHSILKMQQQLWIISYLQEMVEKALTTSPSHPLIKARTEGRFSEGQTTRAGVTLGVDGRSRLPRSHATICLGDRWRGGEVYGRLRTFARVRCAAS